MKNRLKVLRAERNWSQADLAKRIDVSRQAVNAIETGKHDPALKLAFRIDRLFEMHAEEVFLDNDVCLYAVVHQGAAVRSASKPEPCKIGTVHVLPKKVISFNGEIKQAFDASPACVGKYHADTGTTHRFPRD